MTQLPQTCSVIGCDGRIRARGFCPLHYDRWIKNGRVSPGPVHRKVRRAKGKTCSAGGCSAPVRCIGLCSAHYNRARLSDACECGARKQAGSTRCADCYRSGFDEIPTDKVCTGCGVTRSVDQFGWRKDSRGSAKIRARCRECESKYERERTATLRASDPEEHTRRRARSRAVQKAREQADPDMARYRSLMRACSRLKVDRDAVIAAWQATGNVCQACGRTPENGKRVHIDHDHSTGEFRGLLCGSCNTALGMVRDCPDRLAQLAVYLHR